MYFKESTYITVQPETKYFIKCWGKPLNMFCFYPEKFLKHRWYWLCYSSIKYFEKIKYFACLICAISINFFRYVVHLCWTKVIYNLLNLNLYNFRTSLGNINKENSDGPFSPKSKSDARVDGNPTKWVQHPNAAPQCNFRWVSIKSNLASWYERQRIKH